MTPYYQDDAVTIYHGDCREILPELTADLVLTDPPYGIGFESKKARGSSPGARRGSGGHYGRDWGPIVGDDAPFEPAHLLSYDRLILWGAHCYASRLPDSTGWLVWDKKRGGTVSAAFNGSQCDLAWTNVIGHVRTFSHLWDGLRRDSEIGSHLHPTQKPVRLMAWCISLTPDAEVILDPYAGSGPVLRAAKDLGRKAIGVELEERYCEIAARRLAQEVLDFGGVA
jgi:site-specific DNA-methyltransferase (adenine-specific)